MKNWWCLLVYTAKGMLGLYTYWLGFDRPDQQVIEQRRSICLNCKSNYVWIKWHRCAACGCFINAKTAIGKEGCPLDKWNV